MKKFKKYVLVTLTFIAMLIIANKSYAASTSLKVSSNSVTTGTNVTITVGVNSAEAWVLNLSSTGGNLGGTTSDSGTPGKEVTQTAMTATFSAPTAGTYTIKLTGQVTGSDLVRHDVNEVAKITVTNPVQQPTPQTKPTTKPTTKPATNQPTLTFTSVNETVSTTTNVVVRSNYSTKASPLGQLKKGESITRIGVSSGKVDGHSWSKVSYNGKTGYMASEYLTTAPSTQPSVTPSAQPSSEPSIEPSASPSGEQKSNDSRLKALSIVGVELTPAFNPNITNYVASVEDNVTDVEVKAEVNQEKATCEIVGNNALKTGVNTITIVVTAEDNTVTHYEIELVKGIPVTPVGIGIIGVKENDEKIELELGEPTSVSDSYIEYTINLDEWLKSVGILNIEGYVDIYDGTGYFDLKEGENEYTITASIPNNGGEKTVKYKIIINNPQKKVVKEESKIDYKLIMGIAGTAVIVIGGIALLVVHHKKQNNVDYAETDYSFLRNDEDISKKERKQEMKQEETEAIDIQKDDGGLGKRKGGKHF